MQRSVGAARVFVAEFLKDPCEQTECPLVPKTFSPGPEFFSDSGAGGFLTFLLCLSHKLSSTLMKSPRSQAKLVHSHREEVFGTKPPRTSQRAPRAREPESRRPREPDGFLGLAPSQGVIQKRAPPERSPHAPKCEDRTQQETLQQERCARREAWDSTKKFHRLNVADRSLVTTKTIFEET